MKKSDRLASLGETARAAREGGARGGKSRAALVSRSRRKNGDGLLLFKFKTKRAILFVHMPESFGENPKFLKERFPGLAQSPEAVKAAERTKRRTDKPVPKDAEARIQNYLNRFKK